MQLNQATDYAFRVVLHLAGAPGRIISGQIIAEQQKIPPQFLQKIMRSLAKAEIVKSHRGVDGGFELARSPYKITLLSVIEAMEGHISLNRCLGEQTSYNKCCTEVCPVHKALENIQGQFLQALSQVNFATLAQENKREVDICYG
ncbi:RrF2 family transcriptional regulator [Dendrosporobacter sp. 1207_IL3150]|uniref:RrF2 family transcriptional regulator n=1 Tax=Dendrosporobacter sp. 1207_IL3150 TaxID=3084054 RepID=UPI002FD96DB4